MTEIGSFLRARLDEDEADARLSGAADRVLADVSLHRRLVDMHAPWLLDERSRAQACRECDAAEYPCPTLRVLASPYRDHVEYQQEWSVLEPPGPGRRRSPVRDLVWLAGSRIRSGWRERRRGASH